MKKYALIMIDMQGGFISPASPICIPSAAATVPACARAIDLFHAAGAPVVFATRHYRADGSDVEKCRYDVWLKGGKPLSEECAPEISDAFPPEFIVLPQDYCIIKPRFSAFFQQILSHTFRCNLSDRIVICRNHTNDIFFLNIAVI